MQVELETIIGIETVTTVTETKQIHVSLSEVEAQHVEWALFNAYIREKNHGDVWLPFANALVKTGVKTLDNEKAL